MTLTTHALTGALIGKYISNPYLVIIFSLFAHFTMDHLRHGEYVEVFSKNTSLKNSGWKVLLDFSIGLTIIAILIRFNLNNLTSSEIFNILLGAFFSILPDFITSLYWKFRWNFLKKYYTFHSWVHHYPRYAPERQWTLRNALNDITISVLATILFLL